VAPERANTPEQSHPERYYSEYSPLAVEKMRKLPREATSTALAAIDAALKLGHRPRVDSWRKLSGRMWATVCSECGREVWLIGPAGGWTYGGSAIRESC
jgi:hypothetical protein